MRSVRVNPGLWFLAVVVLGGFTFCAFHLRAQTLPEWRSGYYRGREVTYQVVDGLAIYEGDIILGRAEELEAEASHEQPTSGYRPLSSFISTPSRFWPNGIVPFEIDPAFPNQQRIADAVAYYAQNTPVRWLPHTTEANYVKFVRFTLGSGACFSSSIGMLGGQQLITAEDSCTASSMVHEMGHAIGFWHEQERKDRNRYVTILYENIDKTQFVNYVSPRSVEQDLGFYDFASLMHYTATAFSRNGEFTLQTVPPGIPLRVETFFSAADLDTIQRIYGTPPSSVTVTSNPLGLQINVDGAAITTPATYPWAPGSIHTLEAPGPPSTSTAQYQFGVWSDGGAQVHTITASPSVTVYSASFVRQLKVTATSHPPVPGRSTSIRPHRTAFTPPTPRSGCKPFQPPAFRSNAGFQPPDNPVPLVSPLEFLQTRL